MKQIKDGFLAMPFFLKIISILSAIEGIAFVALGALPNAHLQIGELSLERVELLIFGVLLLISVIGFLYRKHWMRVIFCLPSIYFAIKSPSQYSFNMDNVVDITGTGIPLTLIILMFYLFNKATVREYFKETSNS